MYGLLNTLTRAGRHALTFLLSLRNRRTHPAVYALAIALFLVFGALAIARFPDEQVEDPNVVPIILLCLGAVPLNFFLNSLEYRLQARTVGVDVSIPQALRISVLATASNLLPIPGSIIVRTSSLIEHAGAKRATGTSMAIGLIWLGVTLVPASVAFAFVSSPGAAAALLAVGSATLAAGIVSVRRLTNEWRPIVGRVLVVEALTVVVAGLRLWLVLQGIGFHADVEQLVPLTLAGALASASGFLPAGIGIRETAAAGIAVMVDIPASVGYVAAGADTIATIVVVGFIAGTMILIRSRRDRSPRTAPRSSSNDR